MLIAKITKNTNLSEVSSSEFFVALNILLNINLNLKLNFVSLSLSKTKHTKAYSIKVNHHQQAEHLQAEPIVRLLN